MLISNIQIKKIIDYEIDKTFQIIMCEHENLNEDDCHFALQLAKQAIIERIDRINRLYEN